MYSREYYERIQAKLWELVDWMKTTMPEGAFAQIIEYIEYNELGLALEDIILMLDEQSITVPPKQSEIINDLKNQMGIS